MAQATCKTCGASGPPWNHTPSPLDADGIGNPAHKMTNPMNNTELRDDWVDYSNPREDTKVEDTIDSIECCSAGCAGYIHQDDKKEAIKAIKDLLHSYTQAAVLRGKIEENIILKQDMAQLYAHLPPHYAFVTDRIRTLNKQLEELEKK